MTSPMHIRLVATLGLSGLSALACGGAALEATSPAAPGSSATSTAPATAPVARPAATLAPTSSAGGGLWAVTDKSRATVRVREQLVGVSFPSDAVLVATGATGSFQLNDDGTFSPDSRISFDIATLRSDESARDNFIKQDTLNVRRFSRAELVPTKASGLTLPLATSGVFTFTLAGKMTVHGTEHEVTFDVQAKRDGAELNAIATANPPLRFGDFGMSVPAVPFRVVSVVDEIRLVVEIVAAGPRS